MEVHFSSALDRRDAASEEYSKHVLEADGKLSSFPHVYRFQF